MTGSSKDLSIELCQLEQLKRRLQERQRALHEAEAACEGIPSLRSSLNSAKAKEKEARQRKHEAEAQPIHDRLAQAKHDLGLCRLEVIEWLRQIAGRDQQARWFLEQVQQTSPYPSVRVADEILRLLAALRSSTQMAVPDDADETVAAFPYDRNSEEDREQMARLLAKVIDSPDRNQTWVRLEMDVAEGTLRSLLAEKPVQPGTWRKAQRFLQKLHSEDAP